MADPDIAVVNMDNIDHVAMDTPRPLPPHSPSDPPPHDVAARDVGDAPAALGAPPLEDPATIEDAPAPGSPSARSAAEDDDTQVGSIGITRGLLPGIGDDEEEDRKPIRKQPKITSLRAQTRGGRLRADQERIKSVLKEAIINMCNSGLYYQTEMRIEGLLGITLDRRDVILVNVHDIIRTSASDEEDFVTKVPYTPTVHKRKASRPYRVAGRQYVKRGPGRPRNEDGPAAKRRRKQAQQEEEEDAELSLFSNYQTGESETGNISHLAQAVAWYASVDEEARMADGPLLNDHVGRGFARKQQRKKRRGEYNNYSAEMRAKIGQYAVEQGIGKAMKHFKSIFGRPIGESTVRCMRKAYLDAKRETRADEVVVLPKKDRGRPLMLKEYDSDVMEYIENLRRNGAAINVQIVMDAARGVLLHKDKARLKEFGGNVEVTKAWAQSFMARKGLHGLGRRRRKSDEPKTPRKKKLKEEEVLPEEDEEEDTAGESSNQQQPPQQPLHQMVAAAAQQQQQQTQQQQQPQHQSNTQTQNLQQTAQTQQQPPQHHQQQQQQQQQPNLSQHPTPVHTPHPQDVHDQHNLHTLDVCTPPPAHEQRNNTMVFPERQMHSEPMHDPRGNPMVFDRPHPGDHPPPMHDHSGRMVFPERHPMPPTSSMQDPHHMFFPERLNLNPVPPAHCSLWPSQNIHHKNN